MREREPKVSVIVPVYNTPDDLLKSCLDSIVGQTLKDIEIFFIDDGSEEVTARILDEYGERDERITVVHKKNEGVSIARNTGIEKASGEYIYFIDSDDVLETDALESLYDNAVETGADAVYFPITFLNMKGERFSIGFPYSFVTSDRDFFNLAIGQSCGVENHIGLCWGPYSLLTKRSLIISSGIRFIPHLSVGEDGLFHILILEHMERFSFLNKQFYTYRQLSSGLVQKPKPMDQIILKEKSGYEILSHSEETSALVDYWSVNSIHIALRHHFARARNLSFFRNYAEARRFLNSAPFSDAVRNVDRKMLNRTLKTLVFFLRSHLSFVIWFCYYAGRWRTDRTVYR